MTKTRNQKQNAQRKQRPAPSMARAPKNTGMRPSRPKQLAPRDSYNDSFGSKLGAFLGHGAQQVVKAITGFGDYNIEANTLLDGGLSPPQVINTVKNNGVIIRHREYIMDINSSTSFVNTTLNINPGLSGTFPYLSQIAAAFELYRMRGLVFEFKSTSSDAILSSGSSSALGVVAMATQYNSINAPFTSSLQLQNHEFANASKPSCDFMHPVECKRSEIPNSELYVRTDRIPPNADQRLYDLGQFNIATVDMQNAGTAVIGQLWATYEIEFFQQIYATPFTIRSAHVQIAGASSSAWFGSSRSTPAANTLGLSFPNPNSFQFPESVRDGTYMVMIKYNQGSNVTFTPPLLTVTSDYVLQTPFSGGTSVGGDVSGTTQVFHVIYVLTIVNPSATFALSGGILAGTTTVADLYVTQMPLPLIT